MPDHLISKEEAARILGVSPRTIERYWKRGRLRWKRVDKERRCIEEEVHHLMVSESVSMDKLQDIVQELKGTVKRLEREIIAIKKAVGLNQSVIYSDDDLRAIYQSAKLPLVQKVTTATANMWCTYVENIQEPELFRLTNLTGNPTPWKTLIDRTDELIIAIRRKRRFNKDVLLQNSAIRLEQAKAILLKCSRKHFSETRYSAKEGFLETLSGEEKTPIDMRSLHPGSDVRKTK